LGLEIGPRERVIFLRWVAKVRRPTVTSGELRRSAACSQITLGSLVIFRLVVVTWPPGGVRSIVMSMYVSLSVCLSAHSHNLKTTRPNFTKFYAVCLWPWLGRRSCSGGVVIRYVLPVCG